MKIFNGNKIDTNIFNENYSRMNSLRWNEMQIGKEYMITHDKTIYKGTLIGRTGNICSETHYEQNGRRKIIIWHNIFSVNNYIKYFFENDLYYDLELIRHNASDARKNMEQRALDKVLKRVVNEDFQW